MAILLPPAQAPSSQAPVQNYHLSSKPHLTYDLFGTDHVENVALSLLKSNFCIIKNLPSNGHCSVVSRCSLETNVVSESFTSNSCVTG
jgi:hypothetical protein